MPTYAYACTACGHAFDAVQKFTDSALAECPECGGRLRKVYTSIGVTFKGSGFYRNDSRAGANGSSKGADVIQVTVGEQSRLHGVEVFELRLPAGANVTLVVRDGKGFVPEGRTVLRHGDQLLVVSAAEVRRKAEQRIRDVDEGGRLAGWS